MQTLHTIPKEQLTIVHDQIYDKLLRLITMTRQRIKKLTSYLQRKNRVVTEVQTHQGHHNILGTTSKI